MIGEHEFKFEECRVYTPDGKLKRTYSKEEIHKRHWEGFRLEGNKFSVGTESHAKIFNPNKNIFTRNCVECGNLFTTNHLRAKTCGEVCRTARKKEHGRINSRKQAQRKKAEKK